MAKYMATVYKRLGANFVPQYKKEGKPVKVNDNELDVLMGTCRTYLLIGKREWPKYHIVISKDGEDIGSVKLIEHNKVIFEKTVRPWGTWLVKANGTCGKKIE